MAGRDLVDDLCKERLCSRCFFFGTVGTGGVSECLRVAGGWDRSDCDVVSITVGVVLNVAGFSVSMGSSRVGVTGVNADVIV